MTTKLLTLAATALVIGTSAAMAQPKYDPDHRAVELERRYQADRDNGSITYLEGRSLRREAEAIADRERQLKADGHLSRADRNEIRRLQNQLERDIAAAESNGRRRWIGLPRVGN